jgi:hypothetical protein
VSIKWDECSRSFIDDEFNAWSYTGEPGTWKPRIGNPNRESEMGKKKKDEKEFVVPDWDAALEVIGDYSVSDDSTVVRDVILDDVYPDSITAPAHYTEGRQYEPWDVVADWQLDFFLGNALKYISRAGRKTVDAKEDIQKAIAYLEKRLGMLG